MGLKGLGVELGLFILRHDVTFDQSKKIVSVARVLVAPEVGRRGGVGEDVGRGVENGLGWKNGGVEVRRGSGLGCDGGMAGRKMHGDRGVAGRLGQGGWGDWIEGGQGGTLMVGLTQKHEGGGKGYGTSKGGRQTAEEEFSAMSMIGLLEHTLAFVVVSQKG